MNKPGKKGFARIIAAFGYSLKGLKAAYQNEAAIRQELIAGILIIPLAFFFANNGIELALLLSSALLIFLMELVNSAIESIVDRVGSEYHELSGQAKDIGSALVLVAMIIFVVTWGSILFYPT
ncbi:diacylglycerol kinase [Ignatzschineria sp. LJL83]